MGTTTTEVTVEIQTSLYAALEEKLNANVAQRISWLLQSRDVPLTTLPKGSTFSVRMEQITGADGETLRYGQIRSVQLDAGGKGQFVVEGLGDISAYGQPRYSNFLNSGPASISIESIRVIVVSCKACM